MKIKVSPDKPGFYEAIYYRLLPFAAFQQFLHAPPKFLVDSFRVWKFLVELLQTKMGERWQTLATVQTQISMLKHLVFAASHKEATVTYSMRYVNNFSCNLW